MDTLRREAGALGWLIRTPITFGPVAAAVYKELQLPAGEADVARPPVRRRALRLPHADPAHACCKPFGTRSGNIFSEQPFGVGWTVNCGALLQMLRGLVSSDAPPTTRRRRSRAPRRPDRPIRPTARLR